MRNDQPRTEPVAPRIARTAEYPPSPTDTPAPEPGAESREREAAWRRGQERERWRSEGGGAGADAHVPAVAPGVMQVAFAALAESVRDYAVFLLNPDGVITFWGEGARLMKWWTRDQAEGSHLRMLYPDGGSEDGTAEAHLAESAATGEYTGEGHRVRSDGSTFWAGITLTALRDERGTLLVFAKTTRDLTARRAADGELAAARLAADFALTAAERASRAKSDFLATMSHEIRTPINAILGYHELLDLEVQGTLTDGQRTYLNRAAASGQHLLELVDEVLDFSRLEADRTAVERDAFRLGHVIGDALELVEPQARSRGVALVDSASGHASALRAWGDEGRARQILVNLLSNAVKFTEPRNGEAGRITVSAGMAAQPSPDAELRGEGPWAYVRVEDTGRGIPADQLRAVFEPFVQGDMGLTRRHGGTGLGLAISRRLARLMGGDITAHSEVGMGSDFFLWLPAAPAEGVVRDIAEGQHTGAP